MYLVRKLRGLCALVWDHLTVDEPNQNDHIFAGLLAKITKSSYWLMFLRLKDFIYTLKHSSFQFFCKSFLYENQKLIQAILFHSYLVL